MNFVSPDFLLATPGVVIPTGLTIQDTRFDRPVPGSRNRHLIQEPNLEVVHIPVVQSGRGIPVPGTEKWYPYGLMTARDCYGNLIVEKPGESVQIFPLDCRIMNDTPPRRRPISPPVSPIIHDHSTHHVHSSQECHHNQTKVIERIKVVERIIEKPTNSRINTNSGISSSSQFYTHSNGGFYTGNGKVHVKLEESTVRVNGEPYYVIRGYTCEDIPNQRLLIIRFGSSTKRVPY